mgnify:FL=1
MEEENRAPNRRRSPLSFIFGLIITIGVIVLIVLFSTGSFNQSVTISTTSEFLTQLVSDRITTAKVTPMNQYYHITGKMKKSSGGREYTVNYTFSMDKEEYSTDGFIYFYDVLDANGSVKEGPLSTTDWVDCENNAYKNPSIQHILLDKAAEDKGKQNGFKFYAPENPYQTNFWDEWGPTILLFGGSAILCVFLFSRLAGSIGSSNNKAMDFNKSRARRENKSKVRFSDVAGAEEEKAEMQELVEYLKDPNKYTKFGAKLPKGVLLVGNPGCGKTLLAKAVAGEAGVPFYSVSGSDFVEMFVGVGAGRVRDMFRVAKENAPCLVFIDEIDAVGRQRGAGLGGGNDEREQTLNQLLVEMDGFNDNSGIIVIAATNRDDVLDPALLRAGRFDRKITVSLPDRKGREEIFKVHSRNKTLAKDVSFENLAARTVGFSGADIENIMNEAAILAIRRNKDAIGVDEIDEAIDRRVCGPAKTSRSLSAHEKEVVAYHEAGHAIVGLKYPHSDKVQKITIIPRGNTGGHVRMTPEEDRFLYTKKELEARIVGFLAGRSSEEIFFDDISSGASNDIENATAIARMMVTELGMSSLGPIQYERDTGSVFLGRDYTSSQKMFSSETALKIDGEVRKIIVDSHEIALKLIKDNKEDVILLAQTLMKHEQITAEEIDYLLEHRHLKRDEVVESPKTEETK